MDHVLFAPHGSLLMEEAGSAAQTEQNPTVEPPIEEDNTVEETVSLLGDDASQVRDDDERGACNECVYSDQSFVSQHMTCGSSWCGSLYPRRCD